MNRGLSKNPPTPLLWKLSSTFFHILDSVSRFVSFRDKPLQLQINLMFSSGFLPQPESFPFTDQILELYLSIRLPFFRFEAISFSRCLGCFERAVPGCTAVHPSIRSRLRGKPNSASAFRPGNPKSRGKPSYSTVFSGPRRAAFPRTS